MKDCYDGNDETSATCAAYKERCNFETGLCHWKQSTNDDFDWSRDNAKLKPDGSNIAPVDHTTGANFSLGGL